MHRVLRHVPLFDRRFNRRQDSLGLTSQHVVVGLVDPAHFARRVYQERRRNRHARDSLGAQVDRVSQIELIRHNEIRICQLRSDHPVLVFPSTDLLGPIRRNRDEGYAFSVQRRSKLFPSP